MNGETPQELGAFLEALLFIAERPLSTAEIAELAGVPRLHAEAALSYLADDLEAGERGLRLQRLEESWQLVTAPEVGARLAAYASREEARLTPAALEARSTRHNGVVVTASADARARLKPLLASLSGVQKVAEEGETLFIQPVDRRPVFDEVRALIRQRGIEVQDVRPERGQLEDVFRALTVGGAA